MALLLSACSGANSGDMPDGGPLSPDADPGDAATSDAGPRADAGAAIPDSGVADAQTRACGDGEADRVWEDADVVSNCVSECGTNRDCLTECISRTAGVAPTCALCFADQVDCGSACLACAVDRSSAECSACFCERGCVANIDACTGTTSTICDPPQHYLYYYGEFERVGARNLARLDLSSMITQMLSTAEPDGVLGIATTRAAELIAVREGTFGSAVNLYTADVSGPPTTAVPRRGPDSAVVQMRFSGDGTQLAYLSYSGLPQTGSLHVVDVDGASSPVELATAATIGDFRWVGDTHIAFTADIGALNAFRAWTVDVRTADFPTPLLPEPDPDALGVAGAQPNLLEVDAEGRVYFASDHLPDGELHLFRNTLDGASLEEVPGTAMMRGASPARIGTFGMSRDGTALAFSSDPTIAGIDEIFLLALSGETPVRVDSPLPPDRLTSVLPSPRAELQFSPDGTMIAFVGDHQLSGPLPARRDSPWVAPIDGSGAVRVLSMLRTTRLAWSPDSASLFAIASDESSLGLELYKIDDLASRDQTADTLRLVTVPLDGGVYGMAAL